MKKLVLMTISIMTLLITISIANVSTAVNIYPTKQNFIPGRKY